MQIGNYQAVGNSSINYKVGLNSKISDNKISNPSFSGGEKFNMYGREAGMVLSSISSDARTRLGTTIYKDFFNTQNGLLGKLYNKIIKLQGYMTQKDKSGQVEFVMGSLDRQIEERANNIISDFILPDYISKVFKKDGETVLNIDYSDGYAGIGKGFKLRTTGIELDMPIREQIVKILETAKTHKEIREEINGVKSIYE